jgi:hypothetical protein
MALKKSEKKGDSLLFVSSVDGVEVHVEPIGIVYVVPVPACSFEKQKLKYSTVISGLRKHVPCHRRHSSGGICHSRGLRRVQPYIPFGL